jgi:hypothetical protein
VEEALGRAARVSGGIRRLLEAGVPGWLAEWVPVQALYRWTRPDLGM